MLVGHVAAGLVAKRIEPRISLGTCVLASMLVDLIWCLFLLVGIERVQLQPGLGAANYFASWNVPMSHSLLMDIVWASAFAAIYFWNRHHSRGAWILFAVVASHWLLDVITDWNMPLAPGLNRTVGLRLWASVPATIAVEGGFWLLAVILYIRTTHARKRMGLYGFWIGVTILTWLWYQNITGAPPPSARAAAIGSFVFFSLLVAWAYWMNRLRPTRT